MRGSLLVAFMLLASPAFGECSVKNWNWQDTSAGAKIQGETDCASGTIVIRAYDPSGKWIGNATGVIIGFAFNAWLDQQTPNGMTIKYVIQER